MHSRTANMRGYRVVMTLLSPDSSGIELASMRFCNFKNSGHGGFAIKIFGFAVRSSLLHLSRRDLVFQIPASFKFCIHACAQVKLH